jgi:tetratricopeptide (TPR) repeat protein
MAKKPNKKPIPQAAPIRQQPVNNTATIKEESVKQAFSIKQLCLALAVISILVYGNTIRNGFVLDDVMVLKENTMVLKGFDGIGELMTTPHMRGYLIIPNDMYRPLSLVMFAIEYQFFGEKAWVGHFFNILWFAGCVVMLFLFFDKLFERRKIVIAFIGALVFAVHPIHTEVVANIKSRDELMCFFFAFWSLNVFMNYMKEGKMLQLVSGIVLFFLSFLSKETVVAFLGIIPLIFFFYYNDNKRRAFFITGGVTLATIIFIAIRADILNTYNANQPAPVEFIDNALSGAPSAISKIATEAVIMGKYLKLMFIPYPLLCNYSYNAIPFADLGSIGFWLSIAAYGFIIYFAITRFIKNRKDPWAFAIIFYLATIFLFSNIPFLMGAELAERFAFFASMGFCLAAALAMEKWLIGNDANNLLALKSTKVLAVLVPLVLIFSTLTIARNADWITEITLYKRDAAKSPNDSRLNHYVATAITEKIYPLEKDTVKQRQLDVEAIDYLRKSLAIYPEYTEAHVELGRIYDRKQMYDSAAFHDQKALDINPYNFTANNNLGSIYMTTGKYPEAIVLFKKSLAANPNFKYAYFNLARTYFQLKQYDSAIYNYRFSLMFEPNNLTALQEIASSFFQKQNFDSAEIYFKRVMALMPDDPNVMNNVGAVYLNAKKYGPAAELFKKIINTHPDYLNAYSNLGRCYYFMEQYAPAIEVFTKEVSINFQGSGRDIPYIALSYQKLGNMEMARKYEAIAKQIYSDFKLP